MGAREYRIERSETSEFGETWYMLTLPALASKVLVLFVVPEPLIAALWG